MNHKERIEYLENLDRETLSPLEVSRLLGGSSYYYNLSAKDGKLTLPHFWRGRNLRIFRQPLLDLIRGNDCSSSIDSSSLPTDSDDPAMSDQQQTDAQN